MHKPNFQIHLAFEEKERSSPVDLLGSSVGETLEEVAHKNDPNTSVWVCRASSCVSLSLSKIRRLPFGGIDWHCLGCPDTHTHTHKHTHPHTLKPSHIVNHKQTAHPQEHTLIKTKATNTWRRTNGCSSHMHKQKHTHTHTQTRLCLHWVECLQKVSPCRRLQSDYPMESSCLHHLCVCMRARVNTRLHVYFTVYVCVSGILCVHLPFVKKLSEGHCNFVHNVCRIWE